MQIDGEMNDQLHAISAKALTRWQCFLMKTSAISKWP